ESGVKDGDVRRIRKKCARLIIRFHRARIMERRQFGDLLQRRPNMFIDQNRLAEIGPTMNEPVPDCCDGFICELPQICAAPQKLICFAVKQTQFKAARPGIDDQDAQLRNFQFAISGGSNPKSLMYWRCCRIFILYRRTKSSAFEE